MSTNQAYKSVATATAVTDGGATETVVLTVPAPQYDEQTGQGLLISGSLNITTGTEGVAVVVKVRRGTTISGTLIGVATTSTSTAADKYSIPFDVLDNTGGESSTSTYVVTVTETSADADGTVNQVTAVVEAIGG